CSTAKDFESRADSLCPLAHSRESPVSLLAPPQNLRIDSTPVIANQDPHLPDPIVKFNCNVARSGVAKRIHQSFAADTVKVVTYGCAHRQRRSFHNDTKVNSFVQVKFLPDTRKCTLQIVMVVAGEPQPSHHVVPLFDHLTH